MAPRIELTTAEADAPAKARPLPVVVRLSLAELVLLAERAGGAPLPFDLSSFAGAGTDVEEEDVLARRLSGGAPSPRRQARDRVREALAEAQDDPVDAVRRLTDLGLLDAGGTPVPDVAAALGLLAAPEALLVLDLAVTRTGPEDRLRAWFAVTGTQVAQLSTASGLVVELSWYDIGGLPAALARAATVEDDSVPSAGVDVDGSDDSGFLAGRTTLPFELFSDGTEAVRRDRPDLLAELVRIAPAATSVDGVEVTPEEAATLVAQLEGATTGRLRVLATAPEPDNGGRRTAGVVSWLRVGDGWRSLVPVVRAGTRLVEITPVAPRDLARAVGPVLAEVL